MLVMIISYLRTYSTSLHCVLIVVLVLIFGGLHGNVANYFIPFFRALTHPVVVCVGSSRKNRRREPHQSSCSQALALVCIVIGGKYLL